MHLAECHQCGKIFSPNYKQLWKLKNGISRGIFCSKECLHKHQNKKSLVPCAMCGKHIWKQQAEIRKSKSGNMFCSSTCAIRWGNFHHKKKLRRSAIEIFIEESLRRDFPDLEMHFNTNDIIESELDVYIPSLNIAIEINGAFHYRPIKGEHKLLQSKENDARKVAACKEKGIALYVLNASEFKSLTSKNRERYYPQIRQLIKKILGEKNDKKADE